MPGSRRSWSTADLFAFDGSDVEGGRSLRLCRIDPVASVSEDDVLDLVTRVDWPGPAAIGEAIRAVAASRGRAVPPDRPVDANQADGSWHPIPYQGIDGPVGPFHVLLGTADFIEDAGIAIPESIRPLLRDYAERGWLAVLVGACRPNGSTSHRSLIAILALAEAEGDANEPDGRTIPTKQCRQRKLSLSGLRGFPGLSQRILRRWAMVGAIVALSALAGVGLASLRVAGDEVAVIQRFGKVVAHCGPGLHVRPLWPFEKTTRINPRLPRSVLIGGAIEEMDASGKAGPAWDALMLAGDVRGEVNSSTPASAPQLEAGPSVSGSQLLRVRARVDYGITDVDAFLLTASDPDRLVGVMGEAVLRAVVGNRSAAAILGPERGAASAQARALLQQRLDALGCGIEVDGVALVDLGIALVEDKVSQARTEQADALARARMEADRTSADAQVEAMEILADAEADRQAIVAEAEHRAARVRSHYAAFRRDPDQTRWRLWMDLLADSPELGKKVIIDPFLSGSPNVLLNSGSRTRFPRAVDTPADERGEP